MTTTITGATGIDNIKAATGAVLQVVSTTKSDTFVSATTSFLDITGLSVSITPTSTSSKILVIASVNHSDSTERSYVRLMRGSTAIGIGDAAGNRVRMSGSAVHGMTTYSIYNSAFNHLDSPSTTSSTTYKIQARSLGGSVYINRSEADRDTADYEERTISTITVMEIAG